MSLRLSSQARQQQPSRACQEELDPENPPSQITPNKQDQQGATKNDKVDSPQQTLLWLPGIPLPPPVFPETSFLWLLLSFAFWFAVGYCTLALNFLEDTEDLAGISELRVTVENCNIFLTGGGNTFHSERVVMLKKLTKFKTHESVNKSSFSLGHRYQVPFMDCSVEISSNDIHRHIIIEDVTQQPVDTSQTLKIIGKGNFTAASLRIVSSSTQLALASVTVPVLDIKVARGVIDVRTVNFVDAKIDTEFGLVNVNHGSSLDVEMDSGAASCAVIHGAACNIVSAEPKPAAIATASTFNTTFNDTCIATPAEPPVCQLQNFASARLNITTGTFCCAAPIHISARPSEAAPVTWRSRDDVVLSSLSTALVSTAASLMMGTSSQARQRMTLHVFARGPCLPVGMWRFTSDVLTLSPLFESIVFISFRLFAPYQKKIAVDAFMGDLWDPDLHEQSSALETVYTNLHASLGAALPKEFLTAFVAPAPRLLRLSSTAQIFTEVGGAVQSSRLEFSDEAQGIIIAAFLSCAIALVVSCVTCVACVRLVKPRLHNWEESRLRPIVASHRRKIASLRDAKSITWDLRIFPTFYPSHGLKISWAEQASFKFASSFKLDIYEHSSLSEPFSILYPSEEVKPDVRDPELRTILLPRKKKLGNVAQTFCHKKAYRFVISVMHADGNIIDKSSISDPCSFGFPTDEFDHLFQIARFLHPLKKHASSAKAFIRQHISLQKDPPMLEVEFRDIQINAVAADAFAAEGSAAKPTKIFDLKLVAGDGRTLNSAQSSAQSAPNCTKVTWQEGRGISEDLVRISLNFSAKTEHVQNPCFHEQQEALKQLFNLHARSDVQITVLPNKTPDIQTRVTLNISLDFPKSPGWSKMLSVLKGNLAILEGFFDKIYPRAQFRPDMKSYTETSECAPLDKALPIDLPNLQVYQFDATGTEYEGHLIEVEVDTPLLCKRSTSQHPLQTSKPRTFVGPPQNFLPKELQGQLPLAKILDKEAACKVLCEFWRKRIIAEMVDQACEADLDLERSFKTERSLTPLSNVSGVMLVPYNLVLRRHSDERGSTTIGKIIGATCSAARNVCRTIYGEELRENCVGSHITQSLPRTGWTQTQNGKCSAEGSLKMGFPVGGASFTFQLHSTDGRKLAASTLTWAEFQELLIQYDRNNRQLQDTRPPQIRFFMSSTQHIRLLEVSCCCAFMNVKHRKGKHFLGDIPNVSYTEGRELKLRWDPLDFGEHKKQNCLVDTVHTVRFNLDARHPLKFEKVTATEQVPNPAEKKADSFIISAADDYIVAIQTWVDTGKKVAGARLFTSRGLKSDWLGRTPQPGSRVEFWQAQLGYYVIDAEWDIKDSQLKLTQHQRATVCYVGALSKTYVTHLAFVLKDVLPNDFAVQAIELSNTDWKSAIEVDEFMFYGRTTEAFNTQKLRKTYQASGANDQEHAWKNFMDTDNRAMHFFLKNDTDGLDKFKFHELTEKIWQIKYLSDTSAERGKAAKAFDFTQVEIVWEPSSTTQAITHTFKPGEETGITYDDKGFVVEVRPDSQAHALRILKGYQIVQIDMEDFSNEAVLKAHEGVRNYKITFKMSTPIVWRAEGDGSELAPTPSSKAEANVQAWIFGPSPKGQACAAVLPDVYDPDGNQATWIFKKGKTEITSHESLLTTRADLHGKAVVAIDDEGYVKKISPNSQAFDNRISEGDQIVKVGTAKCSKKEVMNEVANAEESGADYEVTFKKARPRYVSITSVTVPDKLCGKGGLPEVVPNTGVISWPVSDSPLGVALTSKNAKKIVKSSPVTAWPVLLIQDIELAYASFCRQHKIVREPLVPILEKTFSKSRLGEIQTFLVMDARQGLPFEPQEIIYADGFQKIHANSLDADRTLQKQNYDEPLEPSPDDPVFMERAPEASQAKVLKGASFRKVAWEEDLFLREGLLVANFGWLGSRGVWFTGCLVGSQRLLYFVAIELVVSIVPVIGAYSSWAYLFCQQDVNPMPNQDIARDRMTKYGASESVVSFDPFFHGTPPTHIRVVTYQGLSTAYLGCFVPIVLMVRFLVRPLLPMALVTCLRWMTRLWFLAMLFYLTFYLSMTTLWVVLGALIAPDRFMSLAVMIFSTIGLLKSTWSQLKERARNAFSVAAEMADGALTKFLDATLKQFGLAPEALLEQTTQMNHKNIPTTITNCELNRLVRSEWKGILSKQRQSYLQTSRRKQFNQKVFDFDHGEPASSSRVFGKNDTTPYLEKFRDLSTAENFVNDKCPNWESWVPKFLSPNAKCAGIQQLMGRANILEAPGLSAALRCSLDSETRAHGTSSKSDEYRNRCEEPEMGAFVELRALAQKIAGQRRLNVYVHLECDDLDRAKYLREALEGVIEASRNEAAPPFFSNNIDWCPIFNEKKPLRDVLQLKRGTFRRAPVFREQKQSPQDRSGVSVQVVSAPHRIDHASCEMLQHIVSLLTGTFSASTVGKSAPAPSAATSGVDGGGANSKSQSSSRVQKSSSLHAGKDDLEGQPEGSQSTSKPEETAFGQDLRIGVVSIEADRSFQAAWAKAFESPDEFHMLTHGIEKLGGVQVRGHIHLHLLGKIASFIALLAETANDTGDSTSKAELDEARVSDDNDDGDDADDEGDEVRELSDAKKKAQANWKQIRDTHKDGIESLIRTLSTADADAKKKAQANWKQIRDKHKDGIESLIRTLSMADDCGGWWKPVVDDDEHECWKLKGNLLEALEEYKDILRWAPMAFGIVLSLLGEQQIEVEVNPGQLEQLLLHNGPPAQELRGQLKKILCFLAQERPWPDFDYPLVPEVEHLRDDPKFAQFTFPWTDIDGEYIYDDVEMDELDDFCLPVALKTFLWLAYEVSGPNLSHWIEVDVFGFFQISLSMHNLSFIYLWKFLQSLVHAEREHMLAKILQEINPDSPLQVNKKQLDNFWDSLGLSVELIKALEEAGVRLESKQKHHVQESHKNVRSSQKDDEEQFLSGDDFRKLLLHTPSMNSSEIDGISWAFEQLKLGQKEKKSETDQGPDAKASQQKTQRQPQDQNEDQKDNEDSGEDSGENPIDHDSDEEDQNTADDEQKAMQELVERTMPNSQIRIRLEALYNFVLQNTPVPAKVAKFLDPAQMVHELVHVHAKSLQPKFTSFDNHLKSWVDTKHSKLSATYDAVVQNMLAPDRLDDVVTEFFSRKFRSYLVAVGNMLHDSAPTLRTGAFALGSLDNIMNRLFEFEEVAGPVQANVDKATKLLNAFCYAGLLHDQSTLKKDRGAMRMLAKTAQEVSSASAGLTGQELIKAARRLTDGKVWLRGFVALLKLSGYDPEVRHVSRAYRLELSVGIERLQKEKLQKDNLIFGINIAKDVVDKFKQFDRGTGFMDIDDLPHAYFALTSQCISKAAFGQLMRHAGVCGEIGNPHFGIEIARGDCLGKKGTVEQEDAMLDWSRTEPLWYPQIHRTACGNSRLDTAAMEALRRTEQIWQETSTAHNGVRDGQRLICREGAREFLGRISEIFHQKQGGSRLITFEMFQHIFDQINFPIPERPAMILFSFGGRPGLRKFLKQKDSSRHLFALPFMMLSDGEESVLAISRDLHMSYLTFDSLEFLMQSFEVSITKKGLVAIWNDLPKSSGFLSDLELDEDPGKNPYQGDFADVRHTFTFLERILRTGFWPELMSRVLQEVTETVVHRRELDVCLRNARHNKYGLLPYTCVAQLVLKVAIANPSSETFLAVLSDIGVNRFGQDLMSAMLKQVDDSSNGQLDLLQFVAAVRNFGSRDVPLMVLKRLGLTPGDIIKACAMSFLFLAACCGFILIAFKAFSQGALDGGAIFESILVIGAALGVKISRVSNYDAIKEFIEDEVASLMGIRTGLIGGSCSYTRKVSEPVQARVSKLSVRYNVENKLLAPVGDQQTSKKGLILRPGMEKIELKPELPHNSKKLRWDIKIDNNAMQHGANVTIQDLEKHGFFRRTGEAEHHSQPFILFNEGSGQLTLKVPHEQPLESYKAKKLEDLSKSEPAIEGRPQAAEEASDSASDENMARFQTYFQSKDDQIRPLVFMITCQEQAEGEARATVAKASAWLALYFQRNSNKSYTVKPEDTIVITKPRWGQLEFGSRNSDNKWIITKARIFGDSSFAMRGLLEGACVTQLKNSRTFYDQAPSKKRHWPFSTGSTTQDEVELPENTDPYTVKLEHNEQNKSSNIQWRRGKAETKTNAEFPARRLKSGTCVVFMPEPAEETYVCTEPDTLQIVLKDKKDGRCWTLEKMETKTTSHTFRGVAGFTPDEKGSVEKTSIPALRTFQLRENGPPEGCRIVKVNNESFSKEIWEEATESGADYKLTLEVKSWKPVDGTIAWYEKGDPDECMHDFFTRYQTEIKPVDNTAKVPPKEKNRDSSNEESDAERRDNTTDEETNAVKELSPVKPPPSPTRMPNGRRMQIPMKRDRLATLKDEIAKRLPMLFKNDTKKEDELIPVCVGSRVKLDVPLAGRSSRSQRARISSSKARAWGELDIIETTETPELYEAVMVARESAAFDTFVDLSYTSDEVEPNKSEKCGLCVAASLSTHGHTESNCSTNAPSLSSSRKSPGPIGIAGKIIKGNDDVDAGLHRDILQVKNLHSLLEVGVKIALDMDDNDEQMDNNISLLRDITHVFNPLLQKVCRTMHMTGASTWGRKAMLEARFVCIAKNVLALQWYRVQNCGGRPLFCTSHVDSEDSRLIAHCTAEFCVCDACNGKIIGEDHDKATCTGPDKVTCTPDRLCADCKKHMFNNKVDQDEYLKMEQDHTQGKYRWNVLYMVFTTPLDIEQPCLKVAVRPLIILDMMRSIIKSNGTISQQAEIDTDDGPNTVARLRAMKKVPADLRKDGLWNLVRTGGGLFSSEEPPWLFEPRWHLLEQVFGRKGAVELARKSEFDFHEITSGFATKHDDQEPKKIFLGTVFKQAAKMLPLLFQAVDGVGVGIQLNESLKQLANLVHEFAANEQFDQRLKLLSTSVQNALNQNLSSSQVTLIKSSMIFMVPLFILDVLLRTQLEARLQMDHTALTALQREVVRTMKAICASFGDSGLPPEFRDHVNLILDKWWIARHIFGLVNVRIRLRLNPLPEVFLQEVLPIIIGFKGGRMQGRARQICERFILAESVEVLLPCAIKELVNLVKLVIEGKCDASDEDCGCFGELVSDFIQKEFGISGGVRELLATFDIDEKLAKKMQTFKDHLLLVEDGDLINDCINKKFLENADALMNFVRKLGHYHTAFINFVLPEAGDPGDFGFPLPSDLAKDDVPKLGRLDVGFGFGIASLEKLVRDLLSIYTKMLKDFNGEALRSACARLYDKNNCETDENQDGGEGQVDEDYIETKHNSKAKPKTKRKSQQRKSASGGPKSGKEVPMESLGIQAGEKKLRRTASLVSENRSRATIPTSLPPSGTLQKNEIDGGTGILQEAKKTPDPGDVIQCDSSEPSKSLSSGRQSRAARKKSRAGAIAATTNYTV